MRLINRVATSAVMVMALFFGVQAAHALTDGQLVKSPDSPAIYQVVSGKLRPFLNSRVFKTYYANFDAVKVMNLSGHAVDIPMRPRAGVLMLKFPYNPKVYTVGENGLLRHIPNEKTAQALFGKKWNTFIIELPEELSVHYTYGDELEEQTPVEEDTAVKDDTSTDSKDTIDTEDAKDATDATETTTDTSSDVVTDSATTVTVSYNTALTELAGIDYKNKRSGEGVYAGTFPAPKSTVLDHGYIGFDVFVKPSGTGAFRYTNKIWSKDPIICRDGVRKHFPSTGAEWERVWQEGRTKGKADYTQNDGKTVDQKYNPVVPTTYVGTALADIWKDGYNQEFKKQGKFDKYLFTCSQALESGLLADSNSLVNSLKGFDADGWKLKKADKFTFDMYVPNAWPAEQSFGAGARTRLRIAEDDPNYKLITTNGNPKTTLAAIDIIEYNKASYSRDSTDVEADLSSTATQIAETRVKQTVAEPGDCKLLDPRYKAWQQVKGGVYESILPATYNGKGYSVAPYKVGGKNGVVLTYNLVCQNSAGESFVKYERIFFFMTTEDRLIQMSVNWDNKVLIDGTAGQTILSQLTAVPADKVFDGALFEQFVSKLGSNVR